MGIFLQRILTICLCVVFVGPAFADNIPTSISYAFNVTGLTNHSIERKFKALSNLIQLKESPVYSLHNLEKRMASDYDLLFDLLDSKGFYEAEIHLQRKNDGFLTSIEYQVHEGPRYRIRRMTIDLKEAYEDVLAVYPFLFEDLPAKVGGYVSAERIHDTFEVILQKLSHAGYPFAKVKKHTVELIPKKQRILLKIEVIPGPKVTFGNILVQGQEYVPKTYIQNRAPWEAGNVFDNRKIDLYRSKLAKSRLFDVINIEYSAQADEEKKVPLLVKVRERKFRTLSAGLKYSMNEGASASGTWTHRNLTSKADRFKTSLSLGQLKSKLEVDYEFPDFIWAHKTLAPSFEVLREEGDAYVNKSIGLSSLFRTEFDENDEYFYGLSLDFDHTRKDHQTKKGSMLGFPVGFTLDKRDDILDPSTGYLLNASITPKYGKVADGRFMVKALATGSLYYSFSSKFTVAGWARGGSIAGIALSNVLANQRFYAGGGGSIRGYAYQKAGPLDARGDPIGGKSLLEGGVELRVHATENWGGVLFIEGGKVSTNTLSDLKQEPLFGAGVGLRYYTAIGPIRADLAFPFQKRKKLNGKSVDGPFQFYISIGQGF